MLVPVALGLGFCVLFYMSVIKVPIGTKAIVERMGKYSNELENGYHLIIPFIDELKSVKWTRVEEKRNNNKTSNIMKVFNLTYIPIIEQFHDLPPYNIVTNDHIQVSVNALVFYKILNVQKAIYSIDNLYEALESLLETRIRTYVTSVDFETIYLSKDVVTTSILNSLTNIGKDWGVKITRFEIQDVKCSNDILTATEKSAVEKRHHVANLAALESKQQALILEQQSNHEVTLNKIRNDNSVRLSLLECQRLQLEKEHELNRLKQQSELLLKSNISKHEAENIKLLLEAGATKDYLNNRIIIDGWSILASSQNSKIFVPMGVLRSSVFSDS